MILDTCFACWLACRGSAPAVMAADLASMRKTPPCDVRSAVRYGGRSKHCASGLTVVCQLLKGALSRRAHSHRQQMESPSACVRLTNDSTTSGLAWIRSTAPVTDRVSFGTVR